MAKILIVDDLAVNRALVATLVGHLGHQPHEAADGAEALELVRRERPDLVICDILMPTMDGYEFVRRLRAEPEIAGTEVIFYSAYYHEREARSLAQACGVTRVLSKPCEPEDLLRVIGEALVRQLDPAAAAVPADFDREHVRLMTDQLSARAEELQASNQRYAALIDLNLQLASEGDPHTLLDRVCRGARDLLGAKYAVLAVREKNNGGDTYFSLSGIDSVLAESLAPPAMQSGLLGEVGSGRTSLRLANPGGAAERFGLPAGYPPALSGLAAPVASLSATYGWIFLADKLGREQFEEEDERLLSILAAQVGRIYENGSLYYRLQPRTDQLQIEVGERERTGHMLLGMIQRLEALRALDGEILEAHSPAEIAGAALQHLAQLAPFWSASVIMFERDTGVATILAQQRGPGSRFELSIQQPLGLDQQPDLETLQRGEVRNVPDLAGLSDPPPMLRNLWDQGMRSYVRIPIMFEGALAGALSIGSDQPAHFTEQQIEIAKTIADRLGIALLQANLRQRISQQAAELERRVVERTAQLEAANAELEAFSYTVSHDLRGPLRAIDGFSRMLEEDHAGKLNADGQHLLGTIRKNSLRMDALIEDLLRFAHLGRAHLSNGHVDMTELAREAWTEIGAGERVEFRLGELADVLGDRALLKQVWVNLLSNAHKYSGKREHPVVEVSMSQDGTERAYCVSDNGAGFDARYADKLFGVFQRLHSEQEFPGTGVGLAMVHRVVTRHGGRVWADSVLGQGARFYFTLPRVTSAFPGT
jgi:signal transduction histidine kinase/DNA-binding response OmpR family regulator